MSIVGRCKLSDNQGGLIVFISSLSVRTLQGMSYSSNYMLRKKAWPHCDVNMGGPQDCCATLQFLSSFGWGNKSSRHNPSLQSWRNCLNNELTLLGYENPCNILWPWLVINYHVRQTPLQWSAFFPSKFPLQLQEHAANLEFHLRVPACSWHALC